MQEIEKLKLEINNLKEENKKLLEQNNHLLNNRDIAKTNAEIIIIKAINKAYEIRAKLSDVLESIKGKTFEEGIKILQNFVMNHKYYLGSNIIESKQNAKDFVQEIVNNLD